MEIADIKKKFKELGVPLYADDAWQVQKVWVMKHKALERLAGGLKIKWEKPQIIRAEADEAVLLAMGSLDSGAVEWSIGEAKVVPMVPTGKKNKWGKDEVQPAEGAIGNYQVTPKQASYVWAMAEKRAKDRVIIKLAGLHGAYSEEEADDFKAKNAGKAEEPETPATSTSTTQVEVERTEAPAQEQAQPAQEQAQPAAANDAGQPQDYDTKVAEEQAFKAKIDGFTVKADVTSFMNSAETKAMLDARPESVRKELKDYAIAKFQKLPAQAA